MKYLTTLIVISVPLILLANILVYNLKENFVELGDLIDKSEEALLERKELSKDLYENKRILIRSSFKDKDNSDSQNKINESYEEEFLRKSREYKNEIESPVPTDYEEATFVIQGDSKELEDVTASTESIQNSIDTLLASRKNTLCSTWPKTTDSSSLKWYVADKGELTLPNINGYNSLSLDKKIVIVKLIVPVEYSKKVDFSSLVNFIKREAINSVSTIEFHIPKDRFWSSLPDLDKFNALYQDNTVAVYACEKNSDDAIFSNSCLDSLK